MAQAFKIEPIHTFDEGARAFRIVRQEIEGGEGTAEPEVSTERTSNAVQLGTELWDQVRQLSNKSKSAQE
ncbi:MAG TPA: hypothetical protein VMH05_18240 [Bryobacteraceae bacterium]|nr:hypothetical protein [Bryobacteraceae bacterium]